LESHVLSVDEMPPHSHANTLYDPGHTHPWFNHDGGSVNAGGGFGGYKVLDAITSATTGITLTNASAGSGNAHAIVQPTIICNYILRII
jgi:microcystin-dependent protein